MKKFKKAIALFSAVAMSTQLISVMPVQAQESQITAKMHLYDDNGKELYNLNGISDANAKIVIDGEKITGSQLYMAVYGENNKLLEVEKRDLTTLPAEEVFDLTLNGDALQTPKAFLWDGQSPIIDTIAFKLDVITSGEIKGHFTAGNILDFDYEGDGVTDEDIVSYNWERSKSETGTYTTYSTEKSCVTEMDNQTAKCTVYWYKVTATLNNGTSYTTTPVKVDSMPRFNYNASGWKPTGTIKASNPDYTFEVDGQKFVLLDKKATSDKAHYMVIADQTYGKASYRIATGDETYVAEMARIKALLPKVIQDGLVVK